MKFRQWLEDPLCEIRYSEKMGFNPKEIVAFLGKSVVRRPVYHGTNADFTEFQKMKSQRFVLFSAFDVEAQGFFFSESLQDAKGYGRRVITAYVRLLNPLLDPRATPHLGVDRLPLRKEAEIAFILRHMLQKKQDGRFMDLMVQRYYVDDDFAKRKDYTWIYNTIGPGGLVWDCLDNPAVAQAMKRLGYDGTFVQENDQEIKDRSVFVMDPEQVKIVDVRRY